MFRSIGILSICALLIAQSGSASDLQNSNQNLSFKSGDLNLVIRGGSAVLSENLRSKAPRMLALQVLKGDDDRHWFLQPILSESSKADSAPWFELELAPSGHANLKTTGKAPEACSRFAVPFKTDERYLMNETRIYDYVGARSKKFKVIGTSYLGGWSLQGPNESAGLCGQNIGSYLCRGQLFLESVKADFPEEYVMGVFKSRKFLTSDPLWFIDLRQDEGQCLLPALVFSGAIRGEPYVSPPPGYRSK